MLYTKNENGFIPFIVGCIGGLIFVGVAVAAIIVLATSLFGIEEEKTEGGGGGGGGAGGYKITSELNVNGKTIKIPATKGKLCVESATSGTAFSCSGEEMKWYVNMRWPAHEWAWNGKSRSVESTLSLYAKKKIIVINTEAKKAVVTTVCESGPAPWTGSSWYTNTKDRQNGPEFWRRGTPQAFHQFDPPEADGRVAGMTPSAMEAIGAACNGSYTYGFAEDQNLPLGPIPYESIVDPSNAG